MSEFQKLWVKETKFLYVDLFDDLRRSPLYREAVVEQAVSDDNKDDTLANQYRHNGNKLFEQNDFKAAIEEYNKSLCFAINEPLSLAYANRAACFIGLAMYDEGLIDIELAQKANYPNHLRPKLEQRKLTCLQQLETSVKRPPLEPQLSFNADEEITCMATAFKLARNEEFGRHFIAQCDIEEDQVVMVEESLVKLIAQDSKYRRCHSCLKECTNVIPCGKCTKAMFCSDVACSTDKYHQNECNMKFVKLFDGKTGQAAQNCVKFLRRAIQIGLENFTSSDDLMQFVELFRSDSDPIDVVEADGTPEAVLGIFLTHNHQVPCEVGRKKILIISCVAFDSIMSDPRLQTMFATKTIQRFLMHLLTHFASMFASSNILLQDWSQKWSDVIEHDGKETFGAGLFNISTYFNHACMPNIVRLTTTTHTVIKTIRPIKKGEQIFVRYAIDPFWPTVQRQQQLLKLCGFHCKCQLCLWNGPTVNDLAVVASEFSTLAMEMGPLFFLGVQEAHKWETMKKKLFQFVKKYESVPMSKSIILSYEFIRMILTRDLVYPAS